MIINYQLLIFNPYGTRIKKRNKKVVLVPLPAAKKMSGNPR